MDAIILEAIDKADYSLRTALAISDLLSCTRNTETLDDTIHETGHTLTMLISEALETIRDLDQHLTEREAE